MVVKYNTINAKDEILDYLDNCEIVYLEHHPEMLNIPISKNKILFEICKFYLNDTRFKIK